jgi:hypothetical protein
MFSIYYFSFILSTFFVKDILQYLFDDKMIASKNRFFYF